MNEATKIRMCPSCGYELSVFQKTMINTSHGTPCPKCIKCVLRESKKSIYAQEIFRWLSIAAVVVVASRLFGGNYDVIFWFGVVGLLVCLGVLLGVKLMSPLHIVTE